MDPTIFFVSTAIDEGSRTFRVASSLRRFGGQSESKIRLKLMGLTGTPISASQCLARAANVLEQVAQGDQLPSIAA